MMVEEIDDGEYNIPDEWMGGDHDDDDEDEAREGRKKFNSTSGVLFIPFSSHKRGDTCVTGERGEKSSKYWLKIKMTGDTGTAQKLCM